MSQGQIEARFGNILFFSNFDSGNLSRVERFKREETEDGGETTSSSYTMPTPPQPDFEFQCWTSPDCGGTTSENGNRTWFYFGVKGCPVGRLMKITIMNLNKQGKLYSQGMTPLAKIVSASGRNRWERIRDRPSYETVDGQFQLSFTYRFPEQRYTAIYFSFCYPFSYEECQQMLTELDVTYKNSQDLSPSSPPESIYYHRELVCSSLDGLRVDLITISSCHGIMNEREPRLHNLFPERGVPRSRKFKGKKVYFLSSRVHPGETPSSFVFNGFLKFLLRPDDPRAATLRKRFIFKLIPLLNPDGVKRGHYRTDSRGVNLNRMYLDPSFALHPTIFAAKSIILHHHEQARILSRECNCVKDEPKQKYKDIKTEEKSIQTTRPQSLPSQKETFTDQNGVNTNKRTVRKQNSWPTLPVTETDIPSVSVGARGEPDGSSPPQSMAALSSPVQETTNAEQEDDNERQPPEGREDKQGGKTLKGADSYHDNNNNTCGNDGCSNKIAHECDKENVSVHERCESQASAKSIFCDISTLCAVLDKVNLDESDDNSSVDDTTDKKDISSSESSPTENESSNVKCNCNVSTDEESGIAFYVDLHGHASKRGCFMYANYLDTEPAYVKSIMYPKMISINSAHFDFSACTFTLRNMYSKDKRDGMSKEGSGRVAIYKATGIPHSYTLECNYNCGRTSNCVPPATCDKGRASPPPPPGFPPKFTMEIFEDVGRNMAISSLDMGGCNPWSRLPMSEHGTVEGVRNWVVRYVRSMKNAPSLPKRLSRVASKTASLVAGATSRQHLTSSVINSKSCSSTSTSSDSSRPKSSERNRTSLAPVKEQGNKLATPKPARRSLTMSVITSPVNNKTVTSPVALRSIARLSKQAAINQVDEQILPVNVTNIGSQGLIQKEKRRVSLPFTKPVPTLKMVRKTASLPTQIVVPATDNTVLKNSTSVRLKGVEIQPFSTNTHLNSLGRTITAQVDQARKSSGTSTDSGDDKKRGRRRQKKNKGGPGRSQNSRFGKFRLDSNLLEGCTVPLIERNSPRNLEGPESSLTQLFTNKTKQTPLNRKTSNTKTRFSSKMMSCEVVDITTLPMHQSPQTDKMDSVAYWIDFHS